MNRKTAMLGYYDYTVILTYCGMLTGFYGVLLSLRQAWWGAVFCLMIAGLCDMLDGSIASMKKDRTVYEKRFGIQIDSLSDLICFGVLPAVFTYMITGQDPAAGVVCALYVLSALIRLAYFNVMEENRQEHTAERRKSYLGVPVTVISIVLPFIYLLISLKIVPNRMVIFPVILIFMGTGFLSRIRVPKPALTGKICVVVIGLIEAVGMFFGMGWDLV